MSFIRKYKKGGTVYLAEVENQWVNGKVVQKYIRHIGKEEDNEIVISLSSKDIQMESVKIYGPLLALHSIAKKIKLPEVFGNYSNEILSLVYAHCMDYKSLKNMPKWYKRTDLNLILNLESLTEARLVSSMDHINDDRIDQYQHTIFNNVKKKYKIDADGLVYDTTNTYFHGKKCQMGRLGKSKEGKMQNKLIQIALVTTQKEGIPLFHKIFNGNIHDSRTLSDILEYFPKSDIRLGLIVYDRGIVSENNLSSAMKVGIDTLCGLPLRNKEKKVVRSFLKKKSINSISNMVKIGESTFYVEELPYSFGSIKGKMALCYNESKKLDATESRRLRVLEAQRLKREGKKVDENLEKYLTPTGRIRESLLEEKEELDGYMCLFCTKKSIPPKEMVRLYFDKDVIERAFKTLKGVSNIRPVRFWLNQRVRSHVFICYLSYLLLSLFKLNLQSKNIKLSPQKAIEELEQMYNVYFFDKKKKVKLTKTVALSKLQEKILRSVDSNTLKNHIL